jgi:hypothetical protein
VSARPPHEVAEEFGSVWSQAVEDVVDVVNEQTVENHPYLVTTHISPRFGHEALGKDPR